MESFKLKALEMCPRLRKEAFISSAKFHLTVCMLALSSQTMVDQAISCLKDRKRKQLELVLEGVEIMKGSLSKCNVIYAKVQQNTQLDELGKEIIIRLANSGLIHDFSPIKWHATLINTRYCPQLRSGFDATEIMERFKNFDFGKITVTSIHLSSLKKPADFLSGYYHSEHKFELQ